MNKTMIARIAWKEYRQQIAFFVVMIALAIVLQVLFATINASTQLMDDFFYLFGVAGGFAALFAVACGATLYATEKETGTFQNLQLLPINSRQLLIGKASTAVGMCVAFLIIATIVGVVTANLMGFETQFYFQGDLILSSWIGAMALIGLSVLEFFAWGWFFSLVTRRPLVAAVLGIMTTSLVVVTLIQVSAGSVYDAFSIAPYVSVWPARMVVAGLVLLADLALALRWLDGPVARRRSRADSPAAEHAIDTSMGKQKSRKSSMLLRLSWQTYRTSWPFVLVYVASVAVAVFIFFSGYALFGMVAGVLSSCIAGVFAFLPDQTRSSYRYLANLGERPTLVWLSRITPWLILVVAVNLIGWSICLFTLGGSWPYVYPLPAIYEALEGSRGGWINAQVLLAAGQIALIASVAATGAFAAGTLCSILFRSSVIAGVAGVALGLIVTAWCFFTMIAATPWWSYVVVAAALLVASRLAVGPWLSQRGLSARFSLSVSIVVISTAIVMVLTARYRATEIPAVSLDFGRGPVSLEHLSEVREAYAAALVDFQTLSEVYDGVDPILDPSPDGSLHKDPIPAPFFMFDFGYEMNVVRQKIMDDFLAANSEVIEELLQAIALGQEYESDLENHPPYFSGQENFPGDVAPPIDQFANRSVVQLLVTRAKSQFDQGEHEESWTTIRALLDFLYQYSLVYPDRAEFGYEVAMKCIGQWAEQEGQTEDSLMDAFYELVDEDWMLTTNHRRLEAQTAELHELIDRGELHTQRRMKTDTMIQRLNQWAVRWLPWENERAHRYVDVVASLIVDKINVWQSQLHRPAMLGASTVSGSSREIARVRNEIYYNWPFTTLWPAEEVRWSKGSFFREMSGARHSSPPFAQLYPRVLAEQRRRMTMAKLAILAWEARHGELPTDIATVFDEFIGPSSVENSQFWLTSSTPGAVNSQIAYSRDGLPGPIVARDGRGRPYIAVPAETPFLSNAGIPWRNDVYFEEEPIPGTDPPEFRVSGYRYEVESGSGVRFGTVLIPLK